MELLAFAQRVFEGPLQRMYADDMLNSNGPDHARIRRIAAHALTPRKVAGYSADVRSVVDGLVGAIPADTEVDAMTALADELPVSTICQLLGLPRSDVERVHDLLRILPYMLSLDATDHEAELLHAWEQLGVLARTQLAARRREPRDDLTTAAIALVSSGWCPFFYVLGEAWAGREVTRIHAR